MAVYQIAVTEAAKADLSYYTASERKIMTAAMRAQMTDSPVVETRNRKRLRDNPIARWELRSGHYRIFYEIDETARQVTIMAVGHKGHNRLFISGQEVQRSRGAAMRTVNLAEEPLDLAAVLNLAGQEPVLLLTPDGKEFVLSEADDFEREVESLRSSSTFQQFLEERSKDPYRIPLNEIEREIEQELSKGEPA